MASRHSTGFTYSLARNSCLNMSMRLECAISSRGAEFPRASARRCLTFPHGVYSAHRLSSRSFSSPTRCTGFADWLHIAEAHYYHGGLPTLPRFRFMVSLTQFSHCTRYEFRFRWTLQYFCILQGQLLSNSSSDTLCAVSSYIGFPSDSCLPTTSAQARTRSLAWEWGRIYPVSLLRASSRWRPTGDSIVFRGRIKGFRYCKMRARGEEICFI